MNNLRSNVLTYKNNGCLRSFIDIIALVAIISFIGGITQSLLTQEERPEVKTPTPIDTTREVVDFDWENDRYIYKDQLEYLARNPQGAYVPHDSIPYRDKPQDATMEDIKAMELGDELRYKGYDVIRIPGGWIWDAGQDLEEEEYEPVK